MFGRQAEFVTKLIVSEVKIKDRCDNFKLVTFDHFLYKKNICLLPRDGGQAMGIPGGGLNPP